MGARVGSTMISLTAQWGLRVMAYTMASPMSCHTKTVRIHV